MYQYFLKFLIYAASVCNRYSNHHKFCILNFGNDSIISYTVAPVPRQVTRQCFPVKSRIGRSHDIFLHP